MIDTRLNKYARAESGVRISMPIEVAEMKRQKNIAYGSQQGVRKAVALLWLFRSGKLDKNAVRDQIVGNCEGFDLEGLASLNEILDDLNPLGVKHYD
jgi:hypothetical protein